MQLKIYEPPRLFEALLRGRPLEDVPDITARICGICPVAYQMSSVHALEAALGVHDRAEIRRLRRLLYCGEWIESHALHMHLLHAPDFLGLRKRPGDGQRYPDEVNRGLRLKKHGNQLARSASAAGRSIRSTSPWAASTACRAARSWRRSSPISSGACKRRSTRRAGWRASTFPSSSSPTSSSPSRIPTNTR